MFLTLAAAFALAVSAPGSEPTPAPPLALKKLPSPAAAAAATTPATPAADPKCPAPDLGAKKPFGQRDEHGIESITIKRTPCFGTCPAYTFTAHADGRAELVVDRFMEPLGTHPGAINTWEFDNIARLAKDTGFFCMNDSYRAHVTDLPTTYITIMNKDGTQKTVEDYGHIGPTALWAIEELVDDMMREAKYDDGAHPARASSTPRKAPALPK